MRTGLLNRQITILNPVSTARSTSGAPIVTWSTYLANIWAKVEPVKGDERFTGRRRWEVDEVDFVTRWTTAVENIGNDYRVRYNSNDYEIKSVINVDEGNHTIKLMTVLHK